MSVKFCKLFLGFLGFLYSNITYNQNLVPNSSFEDYFMNENGSYQPYNWMRVTGSPSFIIESLNSDFDIEGFVDERFNLEPGLLDILNWSEVKNTNCIYLYLNESVGSFLNDTLIKDSIYYIEYKIANRVDDTHFSNNSGIYLTKKKEYIASVGDLTRRIKPILTPIGYIKNSYKWYKISGLYKATESINYLIIGPSYPNDYNKCLKNDKSTLKGGRIGYYIDDIKVMKYSYFVDSMVLMLINDKKITVTDLNFEINSYSIDTSSYFEIDKIADIIKKVPDKKLLISGHTDNEGNYQKNIDLSLNRAKAVVGYLILKGIDTSRLQYKGFGSSKPVASNDTEEGKAMNRRVEIEIIK